MSDVTIPKNRFWQEKIFMNPYYISMDIVKCIRNKIQFIYEHAKMHIFFFLFIYLLLEYIKEMMGLLIIS
jgi:hypothetical protein